MNAELWNPKDSMTEGNELRNTTPQVSLWTHLILDRLLFLCIYVLKKSPCTQCFCGKNYKLIGNNKQNDRLVDSMIKYYTINKFVPNKGTMVTCENDSEFNPF